jgi:hypothetical protein
MAEGSYGREAVASLVETLTTENFIGGKTVVILAGYRKNIDQLMKVNQGLKSRFETWVPFPDWTADRATDFVLEKIEIAGFSYSGVREILFRGLSALIPRPGWGNGRDANTMVNKILRHRDIRVARHGVSGQPTEILPQDFQHAVDDFLEARAESVGTEVYERENLDQGKFIRFLMSFFFVFFFF